MAEIRKRTCPAPLKRMKKESEKISTGVEDQKTVIITTLAQNPQLLFEQIIKEELEQPNESLKNLVDDLELDENEIVEILDEESSEKIMNKSNEEIDNGDTTDTSIDSVVASVKTKFPKVQLISPMKNDPETKKRNKVTCAYIFRKGSKKGTRCENYSQSENGVCTVHSKKNEPKEGLIKKITNLENEITNLKQRNLQLENKMNEIEAILKTKPKTTIKYRKFSKLDKETLYKVKRFSSNGIVTLSDSVHDFQAKIPAKMLKLSTTAKLLKYNKEKETFEWL